jgi:hypothetical protein
MRRFGKAIQGIARKTTCKPPIRRLCCCDSPDQNIF